MKESLLAFSAVIAAIIVVLFITSSPEQVSERTSKAQFEKLSLRNPIPPITTGQTPLFIARNKGFFSDNGIDIILEQGSRELNPIKMVAAGKNDFGMIGGPDTLIVARSKGIKVKAIAVLHRYSNFPCIISLKQSEINNIEDLHEKKVGFFYGHISTDILRYLFEQQNIKVTEVNVGFDYNQLLTGRVDAQWGFTVRAAIQLPMEDIGINIIYPEDYGVVTHGYTIFAMEDYIEKNPDQVKRFLKSVIAGVDYTLKHQQEAIDILLSLNPSLDKKFALRSQAVFDQVTSNSNAFPIGYMDNSMFQDAYNRLLEQGLLDAEFDIEDVYTTEFLKKLH